MMANTELEALLQEKQLMARLLAEEESCRLDDRIDLSDDGNDRRYLVVDWSRFHRAFRTGNVQIHAVLLDESTPSDSLYVLPESPPPGGPMADIRTLRGAQGNPAIIDELLSEPEPFLKPSRNQRLAVLARSSGCTWKLLAFFEIEAPPVSVVTLPLHEPLRQSPPKPTKVIRLVAETLQGPVSLSSAAFRCSNCSQQTFRTARELRAHQLICRDPPDQIVTLKDPNEALNVEIFVSGSDSSDIIPLDDMPAMHVEILTSGEGQESELLNSFEIDTPEEPEVIDLLDDTPPESDPTPKKTSPALRNRRKSPVKQRQSFDDLLLRPDDDYKEVYDVPGNSRKDQKTSLKGCWKPFCRMGCICESLEVADSRRTKSPRLRLLQKEPPVTTAIRDCYVRMTRLTLSPDRKVFCMDHLKYSCWCIRKKRRILPVASTPIRQPERSPSPKPKRKISPSSSSAKKKGRAKRSLK